MSDTDILDEDFVQIGKDEVNAFLKDEHKFSDEEFVEFACYLAFHRMRYFLSERRKGIRQEMKREGLYSSFYDRGKINDGMKTVQFSDYLAQSPTIMAAHKEGVELTDYEVGRGPVSKRSRSLLGTLLG